MSEPILPTDEQITAMRRAEYVQEHWDAMGERYHEQMTALYRQQFESPLFQDFFREKMADAFDEGVDASNDAYTYGKNEIINPYRKKRA